MLFCCAPPTSLALPALSEVGGRVYVFQSGLGAVGEGKLSNRENARLYGVPNDEQTMFVPDPTRLDRFYGDLAARAAATQVHFTTSSGRACDGGGGVPASSFPTTHAGLCPHSMPQKLALGGAEDRFVRGRKPSQQ